jgi:hypothetical protein
MESRHFLRVSDTVRNRAGNMGRVVEEWALYATVEWADGRREEVDQFDPAVEVVERAVEPS